MAKKSGLGTDNVFSKVVKGETPKRPRTTAGPRRRSTFNLAASAQNELERIWVKARAMAGEDRNAVSKSVLVEAAIIEMIADIDANGEQSRYYKYALEFGDNAAN